jgi:predicted metal-dependent HD superfamily phosphohydrolase
VIDRASWARMWQSLGARDADEGLHRRLIAHWSEKHRHYHTLQHLRECLDHLEASRALARRPAEIAAALWFHDAFYDPQRSDNEARSAQWARECASSAGIAPEVAGRIHDMVMATRHQEVPEDPDAQLLVDIDLAILGSEPARFEESNAQIRKEYAHVPDDEFRQGRMRVLRGFLDRPRLYTTGHFHSTLEAPARENLQRELQSLSG